MARRRLLREITAARARASFSAAARECNVWAGRCDSQGELLLTLRRLPNSKMPRALLVC